MKHISLVTVCACFGGVSALPAPTTPPFIHPRGLLADLGVFGRELSIASFGAVAGDAGDALTNQAAFNAALSAAVPGDAVVVPAGSTFRVVGGIAVADKTNLTILIDGSLDFRDNLDAWPMDDAGTFAHGFIVERCVDVALSSRAATNAVLDGNGRTWWNKEIAGLLPNSGGRPKLVYIDQCADLLVEKLHLKNSPSWNLRVNAVRAELRSIEVTTERLDEVRRNFTFVPSKFLEPQDLNTDGIDPSGRDIVIRGCTINNDDDSIAVKPVDATSVAGPCTQNVTIVDTVLTGMGASIGSVPPHPAHNCVRDIVFRNISMPHTGKGIYIKSNPECAPGATAEITNILYEDIAITRAVWWPIWIGPQQQHEPGQALGDKCGLAYPIEKHCPTQACVTFSNITLRNVRVEQPLLSPGVILGNASNPMRTVVFDNVVVSGGGDYPFGPDYQCAHAHVSAVGGTRPAPACH